MLAFALPFLISFILTALLTPGVIWLARRQGWISLPREDRWHSRPTALMGGIAIFVGTLAAWGTLGDAPAIRLIALLAAAMFLVGVVDDRLYELRPHQKLISQIILALGLMAFGISFEGLHPALALPLTLVWIVGITNAVNLLDNMDGLAAGTSAIACVVLGLHCAVNGDGATGGALAALAGGCVGFLLYNGKPAKIFMGDCGSMFIGFSLAALAVQGTHRSEPSLLLSLLIPLMVLAVPIFDTSLVAVARLLHNRPVLPGYRDHASHRMVTLGLSERATVVVLYGLTALSGVLALAARQLSILLVVLLAVLLGTGLIFLGYYLGLVKVYPEDPSLGHGQTRGYKLRLLYRRNVMQVLLDLILIPSAFVGAHLLRFEGDLSPVFVDGVLGALPLVVGVKLLALSLCRAYRGVWRYAGMGDALTAVAGAMVGSLIGAVLLGLLFDFRGLSRSALFIDWLLFTALAVAARMGYAVLRHLFGMFPHPDARRVVILGSGEDGLALINKFRDPLSAERIHIIGILDDDPMSRQRALNGVPVLGPLSELPTLVARDRVSLCVLGVSPHSPSGERILEFCSNRSITLYRGLDSPLGQGHLVANLT